jgi:putative hemolysin
MIPGVSVGVDLGIGPWTAGLVVLLFAASFFFSGTETALFSLQKLDLKQLARSGRTGAVASGLLKRRAALITAILIGNEAANVALSTTGAGIAHRLLPGASWVNVVVLTPVLLLISEITPKVIAYRYNVGWARMAALPLAFFFFVTAPLRWIFVPLVTAAARMFGADPRQAEAGLAEDELMVLVDQSAAAGELDPLERDIIEAVFEFDDQPIERLMTPQHDMIALALELPWDELIEGCRQAKHSRIPVYSERVDNIIGVLLLKDLLKYRETPLAGPMQLRTLLLPPIIVPASKTADSMLREFLEQRFHMAFVYDEQGTLVGLVTLDDLIDELLGDQDTDPIVRSAPGVMTIRASMSVEEFEDETGIDLPEGAYHTLGGFVFHELGHLPKRGDAFRYDGLQFSVCSMEGRRVGHVEVHTLGMDQEAV